MIPLILYGIAAIVWGGVVWRRLSTLTRRAAHEQDVTEALMTGFRAGVRTGRALPDKDPEEIIAGFRDTIELTSAMLRFEESQMEEKGAGGRRK